MIFLPGFTLALNLALAMNAGAQPWLRGPVTPENLPEHLNRLVYPRNENERAMELTVIGEWYTPEIEAIFKDDERLHAAFERNWPANERKPFGDKDSTLQDPKTRPLIERIRREGPRRRLAHLELDVPPADRSDPDLRIDEIVYGDGRTGGTIATEMIDGKWNTLTVPELKVLLDALLRRHAAEGDESLAPACTWAFRRLIPLLPDDSANLAWRQRLASVMNQWLTSSEYLTRLAGLVNLGILGPAAGPYADDLMRFFNDDNDFSYQAMATFVQIRGEAGLDRMLSRLQLISTIMGLRVCCTQASARQDEKALDSMRHIIAPAVQEMLALMNRPGRRQDPKYAREYRRYARALIDDLKRP